MKPLRGACNGARSLTGSLRRAGQCPLQSFGRDQGLCVRRRLLNPAGLPAGLWPNLNLIERLWWLFKRKMLYNQHFPTFAQFKATVDGFFANLASYREEIRTLILGAFHFVGKQNPQAP
jgi:hypothetical protein